MQVLLCSDVASEGLNLHYFCHRLIHFDLPWFSLASTEREREREKREREKKKKKENQSMAKNSADSVPFRISLSKTTLRIGILFSSKKSLHNILPVGSQSFLSASE